MPDSEHGSTTIYRIVDNYLQIKTACFPRILEFTTVTLLPCGPGSSVGIATAYGLDGPGIESRWGEIFRTCPDRP